MEILKNKVNLTYNKLFLRLIAKIIVILLIIQFLRALIMGGLWLAINPGDNIVIFQLLNGISFIICGSILLLLFKPSLKDLSLNLDDVNKKTQYLYLIGGIVLLIMIFIPYTFAYELDVLVLGLLFGLITPAFEELLFRGYLWNTVQNSLQTKNSALITWIIITLSFGLWHVGYMDVFLIHPKEFALIPLIMSKIMIGLILGAIVGYIRLKTGKVYGSFLFHGLWNTFAP